MGNTVRMASQDHGQHRRVWIVTGAILLVLVVAIGLVLTLGRSAVESYAQQEIIARARANGIILHLTTAEVSASKVHLGRATFELEGVKGLAGSFESADITLRRLTATGIMVDAPTIRTMGEPLGLLRALSDWQAKYTKPNDPNALPTPELARTKFTWSPTAELAPFAVVDDLAYSSTATNVAGETSLAITGSRAQVGAYALQPLALALQLGRESIEVGFGSTQMATAAVRGGWRHVPGADDFHVTFSALPMAGLLQRLNMPLNDPKLAAATCSGAISLRVPEDPKLAYGGQLSLDLVGWTPPHPPELEGFSFANNSKLESMLEIDRALSRVRLTGLTLTSGGFKLAGHGLVELIGLSYAQIKAELKGHLPCSTIASSMAESKLGKAYGRWVAQNAHRTIEGHVDVTVQLQADTRHLDQLKVVRQIGVGCGLRPLTLREALSLGLPPPPDADLLKHAAQNLPKFEIKLPELPQLPPLATVKLPNFEKKK